MANNAFSKFKQLYEKDAPNMIYRVMLLEGNLATVEQVDDVLSGKDVDLSEKTKKLITNIDKAFNYLIASEGKKPTYDFLENINGIVTDGTLSNPMLEGNLRVTPVTISGTSYVPKTQDYYHAVAELISVLDRVTSYPTEENIYEFYLEGMRNQHFNDGNKRTMYFAVNKLLLDKWAGIIVTLPTLDKQDEWLDNLMMYYEHNTYTPKKNAIAYLVNNNTEFL